MKDGVTAEHVLGLGVVLADGSFTRTGGTTVKGVAGLDLTRLFVGSEGTLGVIVEATLALRPARPPSAALLAQFASAVDAGAAVEAILAAGRLPAAMEVMDRTTAAAIIELGHPLLVAGAVPTLVVECAEGEVEAVGRICRAAGAVHVETGCPEQALQARRMIGTAMMAVLARMAGRPTAFVEDLTVPRAALATLMEEVGAVAGEHRLYISVSGHAGEGNLHPLVLFDQDDPGEVRRAEQAHDAIMKVALKLGGRITGEHGVGPLKRAWLRRELDTVGFGLQRGIKELFDPECLLNPGKVFDV